LLLNFLEYFSTICQRAKAADEIILLCIFCHGDDLTYGLEIGGTADEDSLLSISDMKTVLTANDDIQICLLDDFSLFGRLGIYS
jgi:hypothetical protein